MTLMVVNLVELMVSVLGDWLVLWMVSMTVEEKRSVWVKLMEILMVKTLLWEHEMVRML